MEKIIRIYEVVERDEQNRKEEFEMMNDPSYFVLKEYIQKGKNKVETGRTFPLDTIVSFIEIEYLKGHMCASASEKGMSYLYQFATTKGNLKPDCASNLKTEQMAVILPENIMDRYFMSQPIQEMKNALDGSIEGIERIGARQGRLKVQRLHKFKKAVGVIAAIAGATYLVVKGIPEFYEFVKTQQSMQKQLEIEWLKQLGPTRSELQQMDDYSELEEWDVYLEQQRETYHKQY